MRMEICLAGSRMLPADNVKQQKNSGTSATAFLWFRLFILCIMNCASVRMVAQKDASDMAAISPRFASDMKLYRILKLSYRVLAIGWMAVCFFGSLMAVSQFQYLRWLLEGKEPLSLFWSGCVVLIYVVGFVASIFLDRGALWSRLVVCGVAFFSAMFCGLDILHGDLLPRWMGLFGFVIFYSWLSIIVLLIPKRYLV